METIFLFIPLNNRPYTKGIQFFCKTFRFQLTLYVCIGNGVFVNIFVCVLVSPSIGIPETLVKREVYDSVELVLYIESWPAPNIQWFKWEGTNLTTE